MNVKLYKCNKLFALYTQEEKDQIDSILAEFEIAMKEAERELTDHHHPEWLNRYERIANPFMQRTEIIHDAVKTRYILAFKGNESAILEDVQEILSVIDKKDFMQEIKIRKSLCISEDILLHSAERIPDPIKREETINNIPAIIKSRKQAAIANYWNCYDFLLSQLTDQIEALQYYGLPLSGLEELTAAKASEWYKKPKSKPKGSTTHIERVEEQAKNPFYSLPVSPANQIIYEIMANKGNVANFPVRKKKFNHDIDIDIQSAGNKRIISIKNKKGTVEITVEIDDINELGTNGQKFLVLILNELCNQALHNGELTQDYITFPLQRLIDENMYSSIRSARRGFESGTDGLQQISIKGTIRKSPKSIISIASTRKPFTGTDIINNQCYVYLNPRMDWNFFAQAFTILPKYYFSLSSRAANLLFYIFILARQHTRDIANKEYFTISFRAIHSWLNLPGEKTAKNPQRDIKDVIETAIEEIETAHSQMYNNTEFALLPVYDENSSISEYLCNGYLKVSLKGAFAEKFISQSLKTEKRIQQAEQRRARITEKAIATNMAKSMKKDKDTNT